MPTYTTIALENLLEPDSSSGNTTKVVGKRFDFDANDVRKSNHIYITPALYTTPASEPIPEVSLEYALSPYVVNHKRRGAGIGGVEIEGVEKLEGEELEDIDFVEAGVGNEIFEDNFVGVEVGNEGSFGVENGISEYLEPVGGLKFGNESFRSVNGGGKSIKGGESYSFVSSQGEFFDAIEDFSSDGSSSSGQLRVHCIESETRAMSLSLLEQIERRKTAEDTLKLMQNQWQRISNLLAHVGLTLPALPIAEDESLQLTQEVIVTKFVAEALGKEVARAEAELVTQAIIESKEQEISRLRDRLQYYEAVNLEMSQRNQEIVEVSRRQRQKRQRQRKWLWSCIGLSIAIGATVIATLSLPTGKEHQLPSSGEAADGSTSSEAV
ncbi:hypothetical protein LIER_15679 [Lithospermum erythrorhizon]|uniref:Transmembrane protein n=1 Tax=Lithospermum erythrorhizon TaxID=34254 RepID=A0AAV3Q6F3_LITER